MLKSTRFEKVNVKLNIDSRILGVCLITSESAYTILYIGISLTLKVKKKGFSFIQTAKLAESEGTLSASGMRPGSNPEPRAPKRVR
jgi:hypothetical protein